MRRGVVLPEERLMGWESLQNKDVEMAKGGMMKPTILGFQEGGMNVDPVSGNEVPVGSLPEEVRDDVDAKLSPGEFVIPADVVRFIGLERLMKMRDEAKKGLQRMSDIGQMGNADEVGEESNSTYEDEGFESEIDDILSEIEAEENGKDVNEQTEVMMAQGGFMKSGTDLTKAPKNPVFDVRYYKNAEGSVMYITHINGKPMTPIPEGYKAVTQEEAQKVGQKADEEKKKAATGSAADQGGYGDSQLDPAVAKFLENETPAERDARMGRINTTLERITGNLPFVGAMKKGAELIFGKPRKDLAPVETRTPTPVGGPLSAPLTEGTGGSLMSAAAADAYSQALSITNDDVLASRAAAMVVEAMNRGVDPAVALDDAVRTAEEIADRSSIGAMFGGTASSAASTSRSYTPSSTVSPTVSATASPVTSTGSTIESRDISAELNVGGGESSVGTPESTPDPFSASFDGPAGPFGAAKGGLVAKRQYPAKKKRGKGIAAATK
jgi:Arc/MetJ-type ribon-helix-helix transcriptional regulator